MDFELYIQRTGSRSPTEDVPKYVAVYNIEYIALWRYGETAKFVDAVGLPFSESQQYSPDGDYRKASRAETAKFLLLVKNDDLKHKSR